MSHIFKRVTDSQTYNNYERVTQSRKRGGSRITCFLMLCMFLVIFAFGAITASAEGTREFIQLSGATRFTKMNTAPILKVYAREGESIYMGSNTKGTVTLVKPSGEKVSLSIAANMNTNAKELNGPVGVILPGNTVATGSAGYTGLVYNVEQTGLHTITMPSSVRWDATVVDNETKEAKLGRVYVDQLSFTIETQATPLYSKVYIVTKDG